MMKRKLEQGEIHAEVISLMEGLSGGWAAELEIKIQGRKRLLTYRVWLRRRLRLGSRIPPQNFNIGPLIPIRWRAQATALAIEATRIYQDTHSIQRDTHGT